MDSEQKRLYLRVTSKLMSLVFLLGLTYVFLLSLPSSPEHRGGTLRVDLGGLQPGAVERLNWENKRILVYRRKELDITSREKLTPFLLDPRSHHSSQPAFAENTYRSLDPRWFVALDYGTDLNCQLDVVGAGEPGPEGVLWQGGWRDRCRGSWYDDAGRVYKHQRALRNLSVPDYRIEGTTLILGSE
jgi:ubiquinol-cytochrome c reductase iron-sulfur subunit